MNTEIRFAAFIMTYKRVSILEETIHKLLSQSCPPQKILIVDNDSEGSAEDVASKFLEVEVVYHFVGHNSGPAGAANIGLRTLVKEGYQWIAWMDDDDPPVFQDTFEILLKTAISDEKCGCVGTVGQYFNKKNGLMRRVPDEVLNESGILEIDTIAGGMCKIVNADVCLKGNVFPDTSLFYGFEELDFDLRLQKAGYKLLVDKELYKKHRIFYKRVGLNKIRGSRKEIKRLWREYYSTRNSMIILSKNNYFQAMAISFFRYIFKMIFGFRFGIKYGLTNFRIISKALVHYFFRKRGSIALYK